VADPADLADPGGPAGLADLWADRAFLRDVQYRTDANLAARQSIYAYQHPRIDLPARVLDLAAPADADMIADVGCGNGAYLAELARRGFGGRMVGADLSAGMLRAARGQVARVRAGAAAPGARAGVAMMLLAADASALPLRDGAADLTLAMHMLYHVPDPMRAAGELRRVTRPGGRVVVGLNGADHMKELREIIATAREVDPAALFGRITLDDGEALLRTVFTSVTRHDLPAELHVPGPEPVADYVRSMSRTQAHADPERLVAEVLSKLPGGLFRITTHAGCLVCA
jgi:SAM-dependent methyltransferase